MTLLFHRDYLHPTGGPGCAQVVYRTPMYDRIRMLVTKATDTGEDVFMYRMQGALHRPFPTGETGRIWGRVGWPQ